MHPRVIVKRLANAVRRRLPRVYDPATQFLIPAGQSFYDPAVFGVYDLASQVVVSKLDAPDKLPFNLDIVCGDTQRYRRCASRLIDADRNHVALRFLEPGTGICLDACTSIPIPIVKETIERLGYTYQAIDADVRHGQRDVQQEDLENLSFADNTIAQIFSVDTLEHVPDYKRALREMHRVLIPERMAVIHLPVYYFDKPEGEPIRPGVDPWDHTRYFSAREVIASAVEADFVLMRAQFCLDYGALVVVLAKP